MNTNTPFLLSWEAPSRRDEEHSKTWYLTAGTIAVAIIAYALLTGSYSLAVTTIAIVGVFVLFQRLPYHRYKLGISQEGFHMDDDVRPWNDFKNFWILTGHEFAELHMSAQKGRDVRVLIEGVDPYAVRDALIAFLPQDPAQREKILDYIIRFCKL